MLGPAPGPPAAHVPYAGESSVPGAAGHKFDVPVDGPAKHTNDPYVTGTSVLGIKYKDGVLIAADTLASYGSTIRYKSIERLHKVNDHTLLGASGEISDYQYISNLLEELATDDFNHDDGLQLNPKEIYAYLTRVLYNRRNKFDPLWNSLVIGGVKNGKSFLGVVGMIGAAYEDDHVATGFGNHLARPIFRSEHRPDMTEDEGVALLEKCLRVLYYRDKQSINKVQVAKVTEKGIEISRPYALASEWSYQAFVDPTKGAEGSW
ncbi:20S proteasome regulatory subunit beta protein [Klebsormidium nitens]|uniref:Proteasome subunit beta n=1 Tax=Klebsormidium nitens TaxID=105231 RepID=A0A1Y1IMD4_KLENI|nr:20S proteasome regulatory subunit beta protein [Klebsormidium nitens]|eukprot:GAQ90311.1 20S proteasome regulatory subunit beta protein [Klebsormidium nitens]